MRLRRWGRHGHVALMNPQNMNVLEVRGRLRRRTGTRWGRRWGRHGHGALMNPQNMNVLEVRTAHIMTVFWIAHIMSAHIR